MSLAELLIIPCALIVAVGLIVAYVKKDWPWKYFSPDETVTRQTLQTEHRRLTALSSPISQQEYQRTAVAPLLHFVSRRPR